MISGVFLKDCLRAQETDNIEALALREPAVARAGSDAGEMDVLRSAVDLHAEILEQLHHEKAQDVEAMGKFTRLFSPQLDLQGWL